MSNNKIAAVAIIIIFLVVSVVVYQNLANNQNTEPTNSTPTPTIEPTAVPTENPTVTPTIAPTSIPTITPIIHISEINYVTENQGEIIITDNVHTYEEVKHKIFLTCMFKVSHEFEAINETTYKLTLRSNYENPQEEIEWFYDEVLKEFGLTS